MINFRLYSLNVNAFILIIIAYFLFSLLFFWPGASTFDNTVIVNGMGAGIVNDWHSPYYQLISIIFYKFSGFQFFIQISLYCFFIIFLVTNCKFNINSFILICFLISPVIINFFTVVGKDQLFTIILIFYITSLIRYSSNNFIYCNVLLILLILIRPNFIIFPLTLFFSSFFLPAYKLKILIHCLLAIFISFFLIFFQEFFFVSLGYKFVHEYNFQYFMISDIINGSIDLFDSNYFNKLNFVNECNKIFDLKSSIFLKLNNDINIGGVWNIDPFYSDNFFGLCHIRNHENIIKLTNIWFDYIFSHPLIWFKYRLLGFLQFFYHESHSFKGLIVQFVYQPGFIFIFCYMLWFKNRLVFYIAFSLLIYFLSYFFYGFGYDMRYWLPIFISVFFLFLFEHNRKIIT